MFVRVAAFVTTVCLCSASVEAQATGGVAVRPRVRITGSQTFEIPSAATGQRHVVLKAGKRFAGSALDVRDRIATVLVDGQHDTLAIPLDSIAKLEVSDPGSGRHLVRGILVGFGAFWGSGALIVSGCPPIGSGCSDAILIAPVAVGIAAGILAGRSRETWKPVPAAWLISQFSSNIDSHSVPGWATP